MPTPEQTAQESPQNIKPVRDGVLVATLFLSVAIALSGTLPLWLDEILQLVETRGTTPAQLIHLLPRHPGAAPLGYLIQHAVFGIAGYSVRMARFPSAIFAAGAVFLTALLGADLGLKRPWVGSALLAVFPLTLRYACESRTYAPALFFSTLASVLFVRLARKSIWPLAALYSLALAAAVYTQPYAIFVGLAHFLWGVVCNKRKVALQTALAGVAALAAFLPWYLWTKTIWVSGIVGAGVHFSYSPRTPLMLFRELTGAGYWGSGLLVVLSFFAFRGGLRVARGALLLTLLIVIPALLAVAADSFFGYFVATRQIMWVLPAVAVLAALGLEGSFRPGLIIAGIFAMVCIWQSFRYFTAPKEDWQLAANAISAAVSADTSRDACLVVVPAEQLRSYAFFRPELTGSKCPAPRTVVAVTPYATAAQREAADSTLAQKGFTRFSSTDVGKSQIDLYSR